MKIKTLNSLWGKNTLNLTLVFCYKNCSDLPWEKNVLVIEKNFWNSRPRICKIFEIIRTIYSNSERSDNFLTFPACFSIPIIFSNFDFNCSNLSGMINLQEQVKKALCYQKFFWTFTVWIDCSNDLKYFANS